MNQVSDTFIRFLKTVRNQAKITTRELAGVVNKSNAYVSILESGKIKTIDFETAFKMLDYVNQKKPFIMGNINGDSSSSALIFDMLISRFNILPQDYIEKALQATEDRQIVKMEELQRIGDKLGIISSLVDEEDLVDLLLAITQANLGNDDIYVLKSCLSIIQDPNKRMALYVFEDIMSPDWGTTNPHLKNEKDTEFYKEMKQLLKTH